ncbi:GFA family protein [Mesobacterium sp. TK19101]|uniref:GFA family protein n=1 Tax=Mesobacterium hydrothermale TaxID=3111907 RepID=A0ABU6HE92_9RHOB|nr:GFA family protein [Mesobacterium sp. TK19101]MEC3859778.1 GFA family protein [Mesobacterium sp. TK19101]
MSEQRTGRCMCGAVRFTATDVPSKGGICHCEMCRRWTGSALIGITVPTGSITWQGEAPSVIQSSDWAERGFCGKCGSGLFFRVTLQGDWFGNTELPVGVFDDPNGFEITNEIYIDHKPDSYAYAGMDGRRLLTRQECVEKFGVLDGGGPED